MTKEAMITYNTLHSAERNKMEGAVKTEARGRPGLPQPWQRLGSADMKACTAAQGRGDLAAVGS